MHPLTHAVPAPDTIVFDLGRVLVDFDYSISSRRIAERSRIPHERVRELIEMSPLLFEYETGTITSRQFYRAVQDHTGFADSIDAFAQVFADIFTPIPEMVALHRQLREAGLATYILSNTNEIAVGHIRRNFPFFAEFDGHILSYEHGSMKPDAHLYEVTESMTGKRGPQLLFMDDRLENVEAARQRGWHGIHHTSHADTAQRLAELDLVPRPD